MGIATSWLQDETKHAKVKKQNPTLLSSSAHAVSPQDQTQDKVSKTITGAAVLVSCY
jgi:hypothetical protein